MVVLLEPTAELQYWFFQYWWNGFWVKLKYWVPSSLTSIFNPLLLPMLRYFPDIYEASGFSSAAAKYGKWFTHDGSPRALIYARDQSKAVDMDSVIKLMRWVHVYRGSCGRWGVL